MIESVHLTGLLLLISFFLEKRSSEKVNTRKKGFKDFKVKILKKSEIASLLEKLNKHLILREKSHEF